MTKYGLPKDIKFCKKCVMPNTRPVSCNEYKHTKDRKHQYMKLDSNGICSACRFNEAKWDGMIDWDKREKELIVLLDKHRSKTGSYDVLVPGSGGKDSVFASHILKYKYGMHPLTVTWAPHLYTDIGWKNFQNWLHVGGFDNYLFTPNGKTYRLLTRNAFLNLLHPFQPFILGQKTFAPKMAVKFNIPLVFYGESPGEYGAPVKISRKGFTSGGGGANEGHGLSPIAISDKPESVFIGGKSLREYGKMGITRTELEPHLPVDPRIIKKNNIDFRYLGYYLKWVPQEAYYYAVKNTGFEANQARTEGTYSKYNSIDDKIDGIFFYTQYIKFGYGRVSHDASQEIRNHHITRDEGMALVRRFDGEFPQKYFEEFLEYIDIKEDRFWKTINSFRDPHLWKNESDEWKLRHQIK